MPDNPFVRAEVLESNRIKLINEAKDAITGCESRELAISLNPNDINLLAHFFAEYDEFARQYAAAFSRLEELGYSRSIPKMHP